MCEVTEPIGRYVPNETLAEKLTQSGTTKDPMHVVQKFKREHTACMLMQEKGGITDSTYILSPRSEDKVGRSRIFCTTTLCQWCLILFENSSEETVSVNTIEWGGGRAVEAIV